MAKILISSPNRIGKSMAGAAIRPWEFAHTLSEHHQVILISPVPTDVKSEIFEILCFDDPHCKNHFKEADFLIVQRLTFPLALLAKWHKIKIIVDAYAPGPLELLERFKHDPQEAQQNKVLAEITNIIFSFKLADGILCASEKQRELWLGFLLGQKQITPALYRSDSNLRQWIAIVPFGLPNQAPKKSGPGLREKFGLRSEDKVILWGGGIWNWFDPLSLIKAMKIIAQQRSDVKLVFMGIHPPDPTLTQTAMTGEAIDLAKKLHLFNQSVFFNTDWIPYDARQNFLLEATIGVSTHFDNLETTFAFRTRLLDYLWTNLPIVATQGDAFADLIEQHQLGTVVPFEHPQAIAEALLHLIDHPQEMEQIKSNMAQVQKQFCWSAATLPLQKMMARLAASPPTMNQWSNAKTLTHFLCTKVREKGFISCLKQFLFRKTS